ncbi:MAG TPA: helix-turn-helix transcriptional regulator [Candidatus Binatia bacterium]|nr:helix-turn-helix transcriptional regulator [Candidatus Binatia bacterium]
MERAATIRATESPLASAFGQKIRDARFSVGESRFIVTFDSGKEYSFSRSSLEVDDGSELVSIQVDRRRFFFRVIQASGNRYEVPWDRVLHEAEPSYRYFRGRKDRTRTAHEAGAKIRKLREAKGITQVELADAVGMMRNNISRIEAAKHRPTLETLERIAKALKVSVADLIVPR